MIIEETISDSFTLDFEILKNFTLEENFKLMMPKLKSHDILKEFEKYVEQIKGKFLDFTKIFEICNEQRKVLLYLNQLFRIIIIKLLKDKSMLDKLISEDKNELVSQKIMIHDELRSKIIDKMNDKIYSLNKNYNDLNNKYHQSKNLVLFLITDRKFLFLKII